MSETSGVDFVKTLERDIRRIEKMDKETKIDIICSICALLPFILPLLLLYIAVTFVGIGVLG